MEKNKKLILILLIAFAIVVTGALLLVKMKDLGYLGGKKTPPKVVDYPISQETKDFSGAIMSINTDKKSIVVKGIDLNEKKQINLDFLIDAYTEIKLADSQEKITLADLMVADAVDIKASGEKNGNWIAEKIQVKENNILGAKVLKVEKNKITVLKEFGELGTSMPYGAMIDATTKIIIKDYSKAIQKESKSFDAKKVVEKVGTIDDLEKDAFVVIYAKEGNVPRKAGDFKVSKIEIILNNK